MTRVQLMASLTVSTPSLWASNGEQSNFNEICSAKMVVTFDSDPYEDERHVGVILSLK